MKTFNIYHPYGGQLNTHCIPAQYEYQYVASISAESVESAFVAAQNENDDYAENGVRSTSVGDIIQCDNDETCYLVKPIGFQEVSGAWIRYLDWGNHNHYKPEELTQEDLQNENDLNGLEIQTYEG